MIGLAAQIAISHQAGVPLANVSFRALESLSKADSQAMEDLSQAVRQLTNLNPRSLVNLEGTFWSSNPAGTGLGGYQVQWVLKHRQEGILGTWSAWVGSYRELISSMPGSGLGQPNGLAGEIAEAAARALAAADARRRQDLDVRLFGLEDGEYVSPSSMSLQPSRNLRVSVLPPDDGYMMKLLILGQRVAGSEVFQVKKWRTASFAEPWNPSFGHFLAVFFVPIRPSGSPSPPVTLDSAAPAFVQEALPLLGPVLAHRAVSIHSPSVRWRVF